MFINKKRILSSLCAVIMTVVVVGRLLSGVHWFTDIIAGALLSVSLLMFYLGSCAVLKKEN